LTAGLLLLLTDSQWSCWCWSHRCTDQSVLVSFYDKQRIATIKGVSNSFIQNSGLSKNIVIGDGVLQDENGDYAILGYGVKAEIGAKLYSESLEPLTIFAPEKGKRLRKDKQSTFSQSQIRISGVYSVNAEFDSKYLLVPTDFARDIFGYVDEITSLEIDLSDHVNSKDFIAQYSEELKENQCFTTREEKNKLVYQASNSERLATILILTFIIIIGAFNMLASLTIIIIDKKKDIGILNSMGGTDQMVQRIFFWQGILIASVGCFAGLLIGALLCFIQQHFGIIQLEGGIVNHYPVKMSLEDFVLTTSIVLGMGFLFTWFPVKYLSRVHVFGSKSASAS
ncbi:MAG: FtsX-like permease family protein, partial [Bacteroidota bacterium]